MVGTSGINVLHVDDEPGFADLAADFLEREDDRFTVEPATSATEGLTMLAERPVDCVVSDFDMPGMDGIEFLSAVREEHPDLPFILFTGKGSEEIASDAISAGVTDYLRKRSGSEQYELLATRIKTAVGQYRAERKLERQNDLFEKAQNLADVGAWEWNPQDGTGHYTEQVYDIYGVDHDHAGTPEEDIQRFYHPEDRDTVRDAVTEAIESGEHFDIEVRVTAADGTHKWVRTRGDPQFENGTCKRVRGTIQDITERKERERELREIRERMEFTLDGTDSVIYDVDLQEYEETRHGAFERLYGLDPEEYSQTSEFYDAAIHPADREKMRVFEQTAELRKRDTVEWEYRTHPDNGEVRWLYSIADIRSGPDGEPVRAFGLVTDVTERKERERELQRQNERLEEFASVVSHDLRNPLNVARGHLDLAREEYDSPHLDHGARSLDRMERLIDDLLALAREGETIIEFEQVDLADVTRACWESVETADATLDIESEATVRADPARLEQLLGNLFSNAVEHGGDDVTVTVGDLTGGLYVADDGPGISEDERDRAFESGYTTAEDGTGFGLSIVRRIAEAHGWEVSITDSDDGGARFEITGVEVVD